MHKPILSLSLFALLAAGCRSEGERVPPSEAPAAAQAEETAMVPALPILTRPAAPPPAAGGEAQAVDPRADRIAAISREYGEAQNAYFEALQQALGGKEEPTAEDWQKAQSTVKQPDTEAFVARVQALLDEDRTDLAAFRAIEWMLDNVRTPEQRASLLALLEQHHLDRPEMGDICERLARDAGELVEKLVAKSPHRDVRGRACLALAEGLKDDLETAEWVRKATPEERKGMQGWMGAKKLAALETLDVARTEQRIAATYDRVVAEFGDVKLGAGTKRETTLGKQAASALFEIRHLVVGQPAPEIEGTDLDGVAFKLSDYRGKVVLLDFWGNW